MANLDFDELGSADFDKVRILLYLLLIEALHQRQAIDGSLALSG